MVPWGCDFSFQNARQEFQNLENIIKFINKNNRFNMTLVMSNPGMYVEALKKEEIEWPVSYADQFPYAQDPQDYWTGYFTSRPGAKKQVKDASSLTDAEMKLFAQKVIEDGVSDQFVNQTLAAKQNLLEQLGVYLHHDAITGTAK